VGDSPHGEGASYLRDGGGSGPRRAGALAATRRTLRLGVRSPEGKARGGHQKDGVRTRRGVVVARMRPDDWHINW
jgi:hypothetical protein